MMIRPFLQINFEIDKLKGENLIMIEKEKKINSRIQQKHDIEENWLKAINFIPKQGEIIVYDIDSNYNYERFKIGDGITPVNALPFLLSSISEVEIDEICVDFNLDENTNSVLDEIDSLIGG